jgi:hypothetical protein
MKNYEKLTIPNDSSWGRDVIWRRLHWRIRYFLTGVKNIFKWAPTLYKDKDWDSWYTYNILQKKIEFQRKEIVNANRYDEVHRDNRDMTIALNLLERVKEDYYGMEYLDYDETKIDFIPVEDNPNLKEMKTTVLSEKYDEFLKKHPSSVRKVLKETEDKNLEKRDLCHYVAIYNQQKARNLLFKLLEQKIERWWD